MKKQESRKATGDRKRIKTARERKHGTSFKLSKWAENLYKLMAVPEKNRSNENIKILRKKIVDLALSNDTSPESIPGFMTQEEVDKRELSALNFMKESSKIKKSNMKNGNSGSVSDNLKSSIGHLGYRGNGF